MKKKTKKQERLRVITVGDKTFPMSQLSEAFKWAASLNPLPEPKATPQHPPGQTP